MVTDIEFVFVFFRIFTGLEKSVVQPDAACNCPVSTTFTNGFTETFSSYLYNENLYSGGGTPSVTCCHVLAFIGKGNSSTT